MKKIVKIIFGKRPIIRLVIYLLIILFFRAFIFGIVKVPDNDMEGNIFSGEKILINKTKYGARGPITLFSIPFVKNAWLDLIQLPYFRMPAMGKMERNDVIAFNYPKEADNPIDKKQVMISRLVGFPGDTLLIDNKDIFINNQGIPNSLNILFNYRVTSDGTVLDLEKLKNYPLTDIKVVADIGIFDITMSRETADALLSEPYIRTVRELRLSSAFSNRKYFPSSGFFSWNSDFMGQFVIPKKGVTVEINHKNIYLYKRIIEVFEDHELIIYLEDVKIDGRKISEYTFKKDYYFVLDDNRDNAQDSRFWGFVPEDHIIGKAGRVLCSSVNKDKSQGYKFRRFLKKIR
ncbi:signal peptidase I [Bacteroidota bacterium]